MSYAVQCLKVNKEFEKRKIFKHDEITKALKDVSFNIEENKIYGFLGRNGAGKTTLLNIISTQIFQTSGEIKIFGEEPYENERILNKICFIKDSMNYMADFKIKDIFSIASDFFENWDEVFKNQLVKSFELEINKKYKVLSKGTGSMVGVIVGLASRAPLTIFDEAYVGLDAVSRKIFYDALLEDYIKNPRTIIFSTHLIDEVSNIFENIIIIHKGQVLLQEDADSVKNKAFELIGNAEALKESIKNKKVLNLEEFGKERKLFVYDEFTLKERRELELEGVILKSMSIQELFVHMTT